LIADQVLGALLAFEAEPVWFTFACLKGRILRRYETGLEVSTTVKALGLDGWPATSEIYMPHLGKLRHIS
jgi:hypothetical protein